MKDTLTGDEWEVRAKVVINATGTARHLSQALWVCFYMYMYVCINACTLYIRIHVHVHVQVLVYNIHV